MIVELPCEILLLHAIAVSVVRIREINFIPESMRLLNPTNVNTRTQADRLADDSFTVCSFSTIYSHTPIFISIHQTIELTS